MPGKGAILSFKQVLMGGLFFSVSSVSFQALFIPPPNLLIIILFQEDNISGTIASLTYGSQIQKHRHAFDNNKTMKIIYSMYRASEVSVHRACCERAIQPYSLGGGGTICPVSRPAGFTTRCPRMVTECLLIRSMLIKMYKFTISGYVPVYVYCIDSQSISYRRSLSLFSFFLFDTTILSEIMSTSNMFWWDLKSSESKEPFKFHSSL